MKNLKVSLTQDMKDIGVSLRNEIKELGLKTNSELLMMKWMLGIIVAGIISLILKAFFI